VLNGKAVLCLSDNLHRNVMLKCVGNRVKRIGGSLRLASVNALRGAEVFPARN
jgi:hypothetical protein